MKVHIPRSFKSSTALCLSLVLLSQLQACGGGANGEVRLSPQLSSGVVTGFGSVFVDGAELEDAKASVVSENASGSLNNAVLQMGQRVRVNHDGQGTASLVTVDAEVMGLVTAVVKNSGNTAVTSLTVAGQTVRVNADPVAGPLTVWAGGLDNIASLVTSGDAVEVHGTPVYDTQSGVYQLVATRIQKLPTLSTLKVNGKISNYNSVAKTFSLNGLTVNFTNATLRPAGGVLANDVVVSVFGPSNALVGSTLSASNIKLNRLQDSSANASTTSQIAGAVSLYNNVNRTFEVQGVRVAMGNATVLPANVSVSNGAYVKVSGVMGSDGSITATSILVREQSLSTDLAKVQLIGVISDFVDNTHFVVRGIPVDATQASLDASCAGVTLANNTNVQVQATQQINTPVVLASRVSCRSLTSLLIRPMDGVASMVDTVAKTLVLTLSNGGTQSAQWNDNTVFVGVTPTGLNAASLRVEGYLSNGILVARVVSSPSAALDDQGFRDSDHNGAANPAWSNYRNRH